MKSGGTASGQLPGSYGELARRLATAILGDEEAGRAAVGRAAEAHEKACDDACDWVDFLARVRFECLAVRDPSRPVHRPSPHHPGDAPTGGIPVDAALVHEAFFSLPAESRSLLWNALLGADTTENDDTAATAAAIATALEALSDAVTAAGFPSAEDIP